MIILTIIISIVAGFFLAVIGTLLVLKKRGYDGLNQIPARHLIDRQNIDRRQEAQSLHDLNGEVAGDFSRTILKATVKIGFGNGQTKSFDVVRLIAESVLDKSIELEEKTLLEAMTTKIIEGGRK